MKNEFFQSLTIELENKILLCIGNFNNSVLPADWKQFQLELQHHQQDPSYRTLNTAMRQEVEKLLKDIEHQLELSVHLAEFFIQIPSSSDITQMKFMRAGDKEDQSQRLQNMVDTIKAYKKDHSLLHVLTTDRIELPKYWRQLLETINQGDKHRASQAFDAIPKDDMILRSLLAVHSAQYLLQLIHFCIDSQSTGAIQVSNDVVVTPRIFALLIKDIAITLTRPGKLHFSFGLPTHHAYGGQSSGFCIINKVAVLMNYIEFNKKNPVHFVIVGTDVNRDNGLCSILMNSCSHLKVCHVDIFDSRVYPLQNFSSITQELAIPAIGLETGINIWLKNNITYFAVDLSLKKRPPKDVHPALVFAIKKIKEQIVNAKTHQHTVSIILPTGWDSHEKETADCGKWINGTLMKTSEAKLTRFNDQDLLFFYENLLALYKENTQHIEGIYWNLEGGYNKSMYQRQIKLLLDCIETNLTLDNAKSTSYLKS